MLKPLNRQNLPIYLSPPQHSISLLPPQRPEEARQKALEIASQGKNLTYSKAKEIVKQHKQKTEAKSSLPKSTSTANELKVTSTESDFTIPPNHTLLDKQPEPQTVDVSAEDFEEEKLLNQEASDQESYTLKSSSNTDNLCKALINNVKYLDEDQVGAIVRAIAKHWSVKKVFELSNDLSAFE